MDDPWGRDTPPALPGETLPLPPRLAALAGLTGPRDLPSGEHVTLPTFSELPEVQALVAQGWHVVGGAMMFMALPAVWPAEHRCWVPDRLPRVSVYSCLGGRRGVEPWTAEEQEDYHAEWAELAAGCGLPAPPRGRIWLLRSPWPSLGYEVLLSVIESRAVEGSGRETATEVTAAAREVLSWTQEQVWDWWQGPEAEAAKQWRREGRVGEDVADVVRRGLTPHHVAALADPAGAALTEPQAVAWSRVVRATGDEAVRLIRDWRAIGLPPDPPAQLRDLEEASPAMVSVWLESGFNLEDVALLQGARLEEALAWRDAGFTGQQTHRFLYADRTLTPQEATAFTMAGRTHEDAIPWVEAGFGAAEARAWTELDVLPQEARVWRSVGKGPADARMHREQGGGPLPPGVQVGWTGYGPEREHRQYGATDPPGTRGRLAQDSAARAARRREIRRDAPEATP